LHFGDWDISVPIGDFSFHVLYVHYGYFLNAIHRHSHSNRSYELHVIPSGSGTLLANGREYPLSPGSVYMTGPDIAHEQRTLQDNPMFEYCICFEAIPAGARTPPASTDDEQAAISRLLTETTFWIGQDTQNMLSTFLQLSEETSNRFIGYSIIVKQLIEQIIIKLVRNYTHNRSSLSTIPSKTLDDKRLALIDQSFLSNYHSITLPNLAQLLGLSIRQTERTLKNDYGSTFMQKRTEARMNAAVHLLSTTAIPVNQIAKQVGYSTLEQFCQAFKKQFNMTATAYRSKKNGS
jgi:AraC-like DNA-binding protein/mannose-6-phosphate isomerase-like protein (cupin superfamily)